MFDDDRRRLQDDLLLEFENEIATQPGVDFFASSEDFLEMSDDDKLRR